MKRIALILLSGLALAGCASPNLKSPCSPVASLGNSPCEHIPINLAALYNRTLEF